MWMASAGIQSSTALSYGGMGSFGAAAGGALPDRSSASPTFGGAGGAAFGCTSSGHLSPTPPAASYWNSGVAASGAFPGNVSGTPNPGYGGTGGFGATVGGVLNGFGGACGAASGCSSQGHLGPTPPAAIRQNSTVAAPGTFLGHSSSTSGFGGAVDIFEDDDDDDLLMQVGRDSIDCCNRSLAAAGVTAGHWPGQHGGHNSAPACTGASFGGLVAGSVPQLGGKTASGVSGLDQPQGGSSCMMSGAIYGQTEIAADPCDGNATLAGASRPAVPILQPGSAVRSSGSWSMSWPSGSSFSDRQNLAARAEHSNAFAASHLGDSHLNNAVPCGEVRQPHGGSPLPGPGPGAVSLEICSGNGSAHRAGTSQPGLATLDLDSGRPGGQHCGCGALYPAGIAMARENLFGNAAFQAQHAVPPQASLSGGIPPRGMAGRPPPNCMCGEPSAELAVRKEGANVGRIFFKCSKQQGEQCNFFEWADEPARTTPGGPSAGGLPLHSGPAAAAGESQGPGPACLCGHPSVPLTVRKEGPNTGRVFYKCPMPQGEQCNFFQWADEAVQEPGPPCSCGLPSSQRKVTKDGPNTGRPFFACARRTCDFFQWGDEDPAAQDRQRRRAIPTPARSGAGSAVPRASSDRAGDVCYKCNCTGHWAQDCPNEGAANGGGNGGRKRGRDGSKGGGRGTGRGRSRRGASENDASFSLFDGGAHYEPY